MTNVIGFLIKPKIGIFDARVDTYNGYSKLKANINVFSGVLMEFTYKESLLLTLIVMVVKISVSETKVLSCVFCLCVWINLKWSFISSLHLIYFLLFSTHFMPVVSLYTKRYITVFKETSCIKMSWDIDHKIITFFECSYCNLNKYGVTMVKYGNKQCFENKCGFHANLYKTYNSFMTKVPFI